MKQPTLRCSKAAFLALVLAGAAQSVHAQVFTYQRSDLCLGFRNSSADNYEVVVDIGQASNYVNLSIGTSISVPNFSLSQLTPVSFPDLNNLSWSVTSYYPLGDTAYPGYPVDTLWATVPRTDVNTQSTPPTREDSGTQSGCVNKIQGIFLDAKAISKAVVVSNQYNTPYLVQESVSTYPNQILSVNMGGIEDSTIGNLNDTWWGDNLEITTPSSFSGSVRSDLYEVRPLTDLNGVIIVDPHTGTNGPAYYVGYFQFNSDGTMTFTRQTSVAPPPPAPTLSISLPSGFILNSSKLTISFATTNGSTYTLHATNSAGLASAVTTWPSLGSLTGNGGIQNFQDTITSSNRVYAVTVH
jgi:hypothetical protein